MITQQHKDNLILSLKTFFEEKTKDYNLDMAFLYGSWATGYPREDSDVDLAVLFLSELLSDDEIFDIITDISYNLSSKINKEVSILPIYRDFRKPMLYYNAIILSNPIYIKDFQEYVKLKNEAIFQMEDFSIFGIKWQIEMTRKNLEALQYG
ncbi:MAG: nucleotidyltransferase domain-containing protein [bacterium]|nr:nucleotidyltransferase domain-containing protein [bacterium]